MKVKCIDNKLQQGMTFVQLEEGEIYEVTENLGHRYNINGSYFYINRFEIVNED